MQTKRCNRLDDFLMKKMLNSEKKHFSDDECYQAYRKFLKLTTKDGKRIAATQTIKKWFGIGGIKRPNREGLFKIGFDLRLSVKEMEELFVYVMREPDFQINDYREMIFLYGFYHQIMQNEVVIKEAVSKLLNEYNRNYAGAVLNGITMGVSISGLPNRLNGTKNINMEYRQ